MNNFQYKKIFPCLPIFLAIGFTLLLWSSVNAGNELTNAPANPAFLAYIEDIGKGGTPPITPDGHGLGLIPDPLDLSHLREQIIFRDRETMTFPSAYDLREQSKVSPVGDQSDCGSCWTFTAIGGIESYLLPSETWNFSEHHLNCSHGFDVPPCEGGNMWMAMAYFARWHGPITETDYPNSSICGYGNRLEGIKHLQDIHYPLVRANSLDNDTIKHAIITYGGVYAQMYWPENINLENSSYNSSTHSFYHNRISVTNHAVLIVGWDDNYDRSKFTTVPPGNGAFIVRNSWGSDWGDNGYFYISYYDWVFPNEVGIFVSVQPNDNYNKLYEYDPLGSTHALGFGSSTAWFANVFYSDSVNYLKAISFYTLSYDSSYEIYIYKNITSAPIDGSLVKTKKGTIPNPGYHTISFGTPVNLDAGENFSIVVRLTTPDFIFPVPIEVPMQYYSSGATAGKGQSYVSPDGIKWTDLVESTPGANVCLKGFSTMAPCFCSLDISNGTIHCSSVLVGNDTYSVDLKQLDNWTKFVVDSVSLAGKKECLSMASFDVASGILHISNLRCGTDSFSVDFVYMEDGYFIIQKYAKNSL